MPNASSRYFARPASCRKAFNKNIGFSRQGKAFGSGCCPCGCPVPVPWLLAARGFPTRRKTNPSHFSARLIPRKPRSQAPAVPRPRPPPTQPGEGGVFPPPRTSPVSIFSAGFCLISLKEIRAKQRCRYRSPMP